MSDKFRFMGMQHDPSFEEIEMRGITRIYDGTSTATPRPSVFIRCPKISHAGSWECEKDLGHDGLCVSKGDGFRGRDPGDTGACLACNGGGVVGQPDNLSWCTTCRGTGRKP